MRRCPRIPSLRALAPALLALACGLPATGCESSPSEASEQGPAQDDPSSGDSPQTKSREVTGERPAPLSPAPRGPAPPPLGCRVVSEQALGTNLGAARLVVRDDGTWVASYARDQGKRSLARFHLKRDGSVEALPPLPLGDAGDTPPKVPPAIAMGEALWIAAVDMRGSLKLYPHAEQPAPEAIPLAEGLDRRFTPALHELAPGRAMVAYTEGDATGMRVHAVVVEDGEPPTLTRHALTPLSHGAAAPRFVLGREAPTLVMIDAHSGMSPLLSVALDARGTPAPANVERPVNLPYLPPQVVALDLPGAAPHLAYTAVGNGATAAVGLVPLGATDPPVAVLRGKGYALLSVDATLGPARALFAVDSPLHSEPDPPLEVQLRVWDGRNFGDPLTLAPDAGKSRSRPAVAYDARSGLVQLVSVHDSQLALTALRCDLGAP